MATPRTVRKWQMRSLIRRVDFARRQTPRRVAAIRARPSDNTNDRTLSFDSQSISRQRFLGILWVFLRVLLEIVQPFKRFVLLYATADSLQGSRAGYLGPDVDAFSLST